MLLSGNVELRAPFHRTFSVHEEFDSGVANTEGVVVDGARLPVGWRHPSKVRPPSEDVLTHTYPSLPTQEIMTRCCWAYPACPGPATVLWSPRRAAVTPVTHCGSAVDL
ncbi:hypothetical protein SGLAM104S_00375 [Streptomyces glaucescens]